MSSPGSPRLTNNLTIVLFCSLAVTGLPGKCLKVLHRLTITLSVIRHAHFWCCYSVTEPRKDHAVAMARFARDCMQKMRVLVVKLEVPLGPGTADLSMVSTVGSSM